MHLHSYDPNNGRIVASVRVKWEDAFKDGKSYDFKAVAAGKTFYAYRHRTPYGWSWFEVRNEAGREVARGDLPKTLHADVTFAEAVQEPCSCGCTAVFNRILMERGLI